MEIRLLAVSTLLFSVSSKTEYHPSSCVGLDDGVQWVRPLMGRIDSHDANDFPSIQVRCDDEYMILDYSLDPNIASYFSSFWVWTDDAASSSLTDRATWTDWFLPYSDKMNFRISEDCHTCQKSTVKSDFTAYFMTGNYIGLSLSLFFSFCFVCYFVVTQNYWHLSRVKCFFDCFLCSYNYFDDILGCMWATKAYCDMDQKSLECYSCMTPAAEEEMPGLCTHIELAADNAIYSKHDQCVSSKWNAVPSLGLTGKYCTCVQPTDDTVIDKAFPALYSSNANEKNGINDIDETDDNVPNAEELDTGSITSENRLVELKNNDFKYGTYRITLPGTYKVMENIEFDMNSPENYDSPNADGNWWPRNDQSNDYSGFYVCPLFVFCVFFPANFFCARILKKGVCFGLERFCSVSVSVSVSFWFWTPFLIW